MATLILSTDGLVLKELNLDKDRITIGRKSSNDVQIDNPAISGEHAAIVTLQESSFLEDLDSTNGTIVNGKTIKRHALRHDDVIEIGKYRIKYLNEAGAAPRKEKKPITQSQISEFVPAPTETLIASLNTSGSGSVYGTINRAHGLLRIISGPKAGLELPLNRPELTLGKPGQQVARIEHKAHGYTISHVEGSPIIVNDKAHSGGGKHALRHLDQIEIQNVKMLFVIDKE